MIFDFARFARRHGVPFVLNPHSPIHTLTLMRGVFGEPRVFVGEEMFRGQDRVDWVAEALR